MTAHLRQCEPCRDRLQQANAFLEASADVADDESGAAASAAARVAWMRSASMEWRDGHVLPRAGERGEFSWEE